MNSDSQQPNASPGSLQQPCSAPADFHGRPLRHPDPKRPLVTGETVANRHGQFLWQVVGCCREGVRLEEQIHGGTTDYSWANFYARFYERADKGPNDQALP